MAKHSDNKEIIKLKYKKELTKTEKLMLLQVVLQVIILGLLIFRG